MIACGLWVACGDVERGPATSDTQETRDAPETGDTQDADVAESDTQDADVPESETQETGDTQDADALETWTWARLPDLPRVLQEHATVALDGEIVLLGGFENLVLVDAVVHYDPVAERFRQGTPLPRPLHHVNAAVVAERMWVLGALEGFGFQATGDTWVFDTTEGWLAQTPMPSGRQRGSAGVAVVADDVYLIGGFRGGAVAECDVYRTTEDRWERLPDLPGARDHGGAAALDGKIYAVGGRRGGIGTIERDLWRLDPAEPTAWVALTPMPTARGGFALGVVHGRLLVVGGEGNPDVSSGVFPHAELYDPLTNQWESLPPMPLPRHGMQAVGIGGALYVPGGADVEAFGATQTFQVLLAP